MPLSEIVTVRAFLSADPDGAIEGVVRLSDLSVSNFRLLMASDAFEISSREIFLFENTANL